MTAQSRSNIDRTFRATEATQIRPVKPKASSKLAATRVPVRLPNKKQSTNGIYQFANNKQRLSALCKRSKVLKTASTNAKKHTFGKYSQLILSCVYLLLCQNHTHHCCRMRHPRKFVNLTEKIEF